MAVATTAFSRAGYVNTTMEEIAKSVGVTQPYLYKLFDSKEQLFAKVLDRVIDVVVDASSRPEFHTEVVRAWDCIGEGRDFHGLDTVENAEAARLLLHGVAASDDPAIGRQVRAGFARIYAACSAGPGTSSAIALANMTHVALLMGLSSLGLGIPTS